MPCHVMAPRAMPYFGMPCHAIFWRGMACHEYSMPCRDRIFFLMDFEKMSKIYAHPLPRVYAIFLFAIEYSAKAQHTTTGEHAGMGATPGAHAHVVVC